MFRISLSFLLAVAFATVRLDAAPPAGWQSQDIGEPTLPGSAEESNGTITVNAGGKDMLASSASDQFRFTYVMLTGDFEVAAHVAHITSAGHQKTRVGIMARDDVQPRAAYQFMQVVRDELSGLSRNAETKEISHSFDGFKVPLELWLKMVRRGDRLTGSWSGDGRNWRVALDLPNPGLPKDVLIGLAANGGSEKDGVTAAFDHVFAGPPRAVPIEGEAAHGETLYNGIQLPAQWPPQDGKTLNGRRPPYLDTPPKVVPIDIGRQLFVDDFLIEQTNLTRTFHTPEKYAGNPILKPETASEKEGGFLKHAYRLASGAGPFDDGVFFDPIDHLFKMWYMAGCCHDTALAYSKDGLHWERPGLDVMPGTNVIIPYDPDFARDGFSQWLDSEALNPAERFKGFYYTRSKARGDSGYLYSSPDGVHWSERKKIKDQSIGDNTLLFYNPFRRKWCLSIRRSQSGMGRMRDYFENEDFFSLADFEKKDTVFWAAADALDKPDPDWVTQNPTQLYTIAAAPYESLMLGLLTIHYGPENDACEKGKFPKLTQIKAAFSRDGFHWDRSNRDVFIAATKKDGDWDRAYVRAAGGGCLVVGDKLYFYYSADSGYNSEGVSNIYAGGSTHLAILRRDGFASMDANGAGGELTTRPVRFSGKYLFANIDAPAGSLTAEILDKAGAVIQPFSAANFVSAGGDATKARLTWRGAADLAAVAGRPVKFRFQLSGGKFYSFWVSPAEEGQSNGCVGAGGPVFDGPLDSPKRTP